MQARNYVNMLGRYNSKKWSNGGVIAAAIGFLLLPNASSQIEVIVFRVALLLSIISIGVNSTVIYRNKKANNN